MRNSKTTAEALKAFAKKLDDPAYRKEIDEALTLAFIQSDNESINEYIDMNFVPETWGDVIAYGLDPDFYKEKAIRSMDLYFQFHGNGD